MKEHSVPQGHAGVVAAVVAPLGLLLLVLGGLLLLGGAIYLLAGWTQAPLVAWWAGAWGLGSLGLGALLFAPFRRGAVHFGLGASLFSALLFLLHFALVSRAEQLTLVSGAAALGVAALCGAVARFSPRS